MKEPPLSTYRPPLGTRLRNSIDYFLARYRHPHALSWDWINPLCILCLAFGSIFFIYSAQMNSSLSQWKMQLLWIFLGAGVYSVTAFFDYRWVMRYSQVIYLGAITMLLLLWSPLGTAREGALRWLDLGIATYQPSEGAKIAVLVMVALLLSREDPKSFREATLLLIKIAGWVLIPMFLVLAQPDLGSALVFVPMVFGMLYLTNLPKRLFMAAIGLGLILVAVLTQV